MYRFGDGTPFPFEDNFIELIPAAVDACVVAFAAAAQHDVQRARAREAKAEADVERAKLDALEESIERAVSPTAPAVGKDATRLQEAAHRALEAARQAIASSKVVLDRAVAAATTEPRIDRALASAAGAMSAFFDRRTLPRTTWAWSWKASAGGEATAVATPFVIVSELTQPPWSGPVRVATLAPGLAVKLPRPKMFGGIAPRRTTLDKAVMIAAERDGGGLTLEIREQGDKPAPGWRVHRATGGGITVQRLEIGNATVGDPYEPTGDDAAGLGQLGDAVCAAIEPTLLDRRAREVRLGKTSVKSLADAAEPARALLDVLTPTLRLLAEHSRTTDEISLKRDIADGKREELFVARAALVAKYAGLPSEYRVLFEVAGLGREPRLVTEEDDRVTDRRPPARAQPPPPPPARALLAS
jgi:hypothetical protein